MRYKLILWIGCIYMVLIGGCVSKAQLDTANTDYRTAQEQLAEREKKDAELHRALEDSKKATDQCRRNQDALKKRQAALKKEIDKVRDENNQLALKIDALNQTIKKKENVISLQKSVIRMFDDSNQTLQNSIQEQSALQD